MRISKNATKKQIFLSCRNAFIVTQLSSLREYNVTIQVVPPPPVVFLWWSAAGVCSPWLHTPAALHHAMRSAAGAEEASQEGI